MLDGMTDSIQGSRIENLHSREVDRQSPTGLILVVVVKLSLVAKWLARKTSPRKPAPCGLWGFKNRPAPFPSQMSYKVTKQGCVYHILGCCLLCCLWGPLFMYC